MVFKVVGNKIQHLLVAFRLLLNQRQRVVITFQEQQPGDGGNQVTVLVLYGAQVIGILLYLAKLQAKGVDIVFAAKTNYPSLRLAV